MDDIRFDRLARLLGARANRRGALAALAALGLAATDADAGRRKRCKPKCAACMRCVRGRCKANLTLDGQSCGEAKVCAGGACLCDPTTCAGCCDGAACVAEGGCCPSGGQCNNGTCGAPADATLAECGGKCTAPGQNRESTRVCGAVAYCPYCDPGCAEAGCGLTSRYGFLDDRKDGIFGNDVQGYYCLSGGGLGNCPTTIGKSCRDYGDEVRCFTRNFGGDECYPICTGA